MATQDCLEPMTAKIMVSCELQSQQIKDNLRINEHKLWFTFP